MGNDEKSLNERIAEAHGYKVEWRYSEADKAGGWVLIYPDGSDRGVICTRPEYAWMGVKDVQRSVTEAWDLLLRLPDDVTPRLVRILQPVDGVMEVWTKCSILHNVMHEEISVVKPDACAAICEAWLLWHEAQRKDGA